MKDPQLETPYSSSSAGRQQNDLWRPFAMAVLFITMTAVAGGSPASNPAPTASTNAALAKLSNMSLEQLMNIKVSILGPSQSVSQTPAAVSVVTAEDIQRSGARTIPEALRLLPGLDVAQVNAAQWAVSVRGFNDQFADKLLVLEDGRSLYTPLFGGVVWDVQQPMMEDIDHIEVVRGPGATLWGANAVNGVINIITKNAEDTQGWLVSGGGGNQETAFADARYGGKIGDDAYYRVYGTYHAHNATETPTGDSAHDSWQLGRGGFRADWTPTADNTFTLQGDGYAGNDDGLVTVYNPGPPPSPDMIRNVMRVGGADLLGRWTHTVSATADYKLQAYYDFTTRQAAQMFDEQRHTFDLNFQNEFTVGKRNKPIWGLGYRVTTDTEKNTPTYSFNPDEETLNLFSAFLQDEVTLVPDHLSLTLGTKLEHNDYTGFEVEPGGRLLWTPTGRQTFWASISRAVRTPSRSDESVTFLQAEPNPFPPPPSFITVTSTGNRNFESETVLAFELGYRAEPAKNLSLDASVFFNNYDHLRSVDFASFSPTPTPTYTYSFNNNLYGDTYGAELSATWRVTTWWQLQPSYTFLKMNLHAHSGSTDPTSAPLLEGESPENQFSLQSSMSLPHGVSCDLGLRYVDSLPSLNIPAYFELDARLAWRITPHLELSVVGQNLLHPQHPEFTGTEVLFQQSEIPRSVYGEITCRF